MVTEHCRLTVGRAIRSLVGCGLSILLGSCGISSTTPAGSAPAELSADLVVPNARTLDLRAFGVEAEALPGYSVFDCDRYASLGVFRFILQPLCSSAVWVDQALYGEGPDRDGDGQLSCADPLVSSELGEPGALFSILCESRSI